MHRASGHTLIRIIYLRRKRGSLQVWCIQAKKKKRAKKCSVKLGGRGLILPYHLLFGHELKDPTNFLAKNFVFFPDIVPILGLLHA